MNKRLKIAVVEIGARHDEVFPVWMHLAEKHGHDIEFFVAPIHQARNIFGLVGGPAPRCYLTSPVRKNGKSRSRLANTVVSAFLRLRALFLLNTRYDIVVANTVDIEDSWHGFLRFVQKPMLAVIHNGYALVGNDRLKQVREDSSKSVVVLSQHIEKFLANSAIPSFTIHPDPGFPQGQFASSAPDDTTFCVQGYINFFRRNYDSLLDAAVALKQKNVRCTFKIIGRLGRSSRIMQSRIEQSGVSEYFTFVGDAESYEDYYREISSCGFLLMLVDDSRMIYNSFFEDKCTSSLGVTLGLGVIPIVNERLAGIYDIADFSIKYESNRVLSGIEAALALDSDQIEGLRTDLEATRKRFADASAAAFDSAIDSALGRRAPGKSSDL